MILSLEATIRRLVADGAWSRMTLDQAFRRALAHDPAAVAFSDPAGEITFVEAHRRIDALASFFAGLGLKPDMAVGIHLPPSADAALVLLAALRAGLIVCPLALHIGRSEMAEIVAAANIRAIVTASTVEGEATGELVRDVAGDAFSIRFVFGLGADLPDGLIDLSDALADPGQFPPPPEILRRGDPADHVAALSLSRAADDRLIVAPLTHNHIVATALAHGLEAGIDGGETMLCTMHPASLAGLAGCLATVLLTGGSAAFRHPTRFADISDAVEASGARRVLLPAAFGPKAAAALPDHVALSLVSTGLDPRGAPDLPPPRRAIDLVTLGGLCLLPVRRRPDGTAGTLPAGAYRPPRTDGEGPVLFETWVKARARPGERRAASGAGELLVSGALIPDAPWPEPTSGGTGAGLSFGADGALKPGVLAQVVADGREIRLRGPLADGMTVAGRTLAPARLDALVRAHPSLADAAVFKVEADLVGGRLGVAVVPRQGERLTLDDLDAFLSECGAGSLDRPTTMIIVKEIPRAADGDVLRQALFLSAVA